jgi:hypothetical protein
VTDETRPRTGCTAWPRSTEIRTRCSRTGAERLAVIRLPLPEVAVTLASAAGDIVFFGEFRDSVMIRVSEVTSVAAHRPPETKTARPTKEQLLLRARRARVERQREQAAQAEQRAACAGGTEVVMGVALNPHSRFTSVPVAEVVITLATSESGFVRLDDGSGGEVLIRRDTVLQLRPIPRQSGPGSETEALDGRPSHDDRGT